MEALWNKHPGLLHIGARLDLSSSEVVRLYVDPIERHHRGGLGTEAVNGAIIAAVFDFTIGLVGHFCARGRRAGTAQISVNFIRPVLGERFEVLGRLVRAGGSMVFAAAELRDQKGEVCASGDGIVSVGRAPVGAAERFAL
jgi:acyl-coenzyme A thioesterase PaaI-like protein